MTPYEKSRFIQAAFKKLGRGEEKDEKHALLKISCRKFQRIGRSYFKIGCALPSLSPR
jgi:hypothetical protein